MNMSKISIFKKISIFNNFRKIINDNEFELEQKFNIRIDKANRMYTVINVPSNLIGEEYNLKKADIDKISENYIKEFSVEFGKFLDSKGLKELYIPYEIKKVDKYSYLIVIGFSLFKSHKYYDNIYYKLIPTLVVLTGLLIFLLN